MKLPDLDDFDLDFNDVEELQKDVPRKSTSEPSKSKPTPKKEKKTEKPKLPKSQYDENGTPILTVPDIDDIDLRKELDRFF